MTSFVDIKRIVILGYKTLHVWHNRASNIFKRLFCKYRECKISLERKVIHECGFTVFLNPKSTFARVKSR